MVAAAVARSVSDAHKALREMKQKHAVAARAASETLKALDEMQRKNTKHMRAKELNDKRVKHYVRAAERASEKEQKATARLREALDDVAAAKKEKQFRICFTNQRWSLKVRASPQNM